MSFSCATCGYGAASRSTPPQCPMCGGTNWHEDGWKLYAALLDEVEAATDESAADEDATAPLQREVAEIDAASILPGVPFS